MIRPITLLIVVIATLSCTPRNSVYLSGSRQFEFVSSSLELPEQEKLYQLNFIQKSEESMSLLLSVKSSKSHLTAIGLTPTGQRLFVATNEGGVFSADLEPYFPIAFPIKYFFADLNIAFWDVKSLRQQLSSSAIDIEDSSKTRTLRHAHTTTPIIEITYSVADKFNADIKYSHLERDYSFSLKLLEN